MHKKKKLTGASCRRLHTVQKNIFVGNTAGTSGCALPVYKWDGGGGWVSLLEKCAPSTSVMPQFVWSIIRNTLFFVNGVIASIMINLRLFRDKK